MEKLHSGTLTGAYGRGIKYTKLQQMVDDFNNGLDFMLHSVIYGSGYCSIRDFEPGTVITFRWNHNRSAAVYTIPKEDENGK